MLHIEAIEPETLVLLRNIQSIPAFEHFRLVGGTALALQFGHRKSIDLDFFGDTKFETINFEAELNKVGEVQNLMARRSIRSYSINDIKVDFVEYPYPWIGEKLIIDGVIMADLKDISAMKMAAITNRGAKKDFFDLNFLLDHLSLESMVNNYSQKYHDSSEFLLYKSLNYFEEAEEDDDPDSLDNITWHQVKNRIRSEHKKYMDNLNL